jgi:lysophospholipase
MDHLMQPKTRDRNPTKLFRIILHRLRNGSIQSVAWWLIYLIGGIVSGNAEPIYGSFQSYDHLTIRTAKWPATGKKRGTLFLLQGMGGFIEGYAPFAERMRTLGFDVFTLDWRGQGGSDRITQKETLLHIKSFDDYVKDFETYLAQQGTCARPIIIVGNSMGGNIALRYIHNHPAAVDGLVALSPMVDMHTQNFPHFIARSLALLLTHLGGEEKYVFGFDQFNLDRCISKFDPNQYGDREKYLSDCVFLNSHKNLATGGPSFSWLKAAFESCELVKDYNFSSRIFIPVLMITVPKDHLVSPEAQREVCSIIPKCRQVLYSEGHHNLLKDEEKIVERVVHDIDRFFKDLPALQTGIPQSVLAMNTADS